MPPKGKKGKGKKKISSESLLNRLDKVYSECIINKNQGKEVIDRLGIAIDLGLKQDRDHSKIIEKVVNDTVSVLEQCNSNGFTKLILERQGSHRTAFVDLCISIERLIAEFNESKEEKSDSANEVNVDLEASELRDLREIESNLATWADRLVAEFLSTSKVKDEVLGRRMTDVKLDALIKRRISLELNLAGSVDFKNIGNDVLLDYLKSCMYLMEMSFFEILTKDFKKSLSQWKGVIGSCNSVEQLGSHLLAFQAGIDMSGMLGSFRNTCDFWRSEASRVDTVQGLAVLLLELDAFSSATASVPGWHNRRISWIQMLSEICRTTTQGALLLVGRQIYFLKANLNVSDFGELKDDNWAQSSAIVDSQSLRKVLVLIAKILARGRVTPAWESLSLAWDARLRHCTSTAVFAELVVDLEEQIPVEILGSDWLYARAAWLKRLGISNYDALHFEKVKRYILMFDYSISSRSFKENYQGSYIRSNWRKSVRNSKAAVDLAWLLLDLETQFEDGALGVTWSMFADSWRNSMISCYKPSQLAVFLIDFVDSTQLLMKKTWSDTEKEWSDRLKTLSIQDEHGRLASVKSKILLIDLCVETGSMQPSWVGTRSHFQAKVSSARSTFEVGSAFVMFLENIGGEFARSAQNYLYRRSQATSALEPRAICRLLLGFGEEMDERFFAPTWRAAKYRFTGILRQVNKELMSEGVLTVMKSFMTTLEKSISRQAFSNSWETVCGAWASGIHAQTSSVRLCAYLIALENHLNDGSFTERYKSVRGKLLSYYTNNNLTEAEFASAILTICRGLNENVFVKEFWSIVQHTWTSLFLDTLLEDERGRLDFLKRAVIASIGEDEKESFDFMNESSLEGVLACLPAQLYGNAKSIAEFAGCLAGQAKRRKTFWDSNSDEAVLREISENQRGLSVRSMRQHVISYIGMISNRFFGKKWQFDGMSEAEAHARRIQKIMSSTGELTIHSVAACTRNAFSSLSNEVFSNQFHGDISSGVLYSLSTAECLWDIGTSLRTMELYTEPQACILYQDCWEVLKLGFLHGIKRHEMSECDYALNFQRKVFDLDYEEAGHVTIGHLVIDDRDRQEAEETGSDLLFGELLVDGVIKCVDKIHMDASKATSLCDLGMGLGKLAMQCYLQHQNLTYVLGVELARTRYYLGEQALLRMIKFFPDEYSLVFHEAVDPRRLRIAVKDSKNRIMEFRKQDLFAVRDEQGHGLDSDIIITETHFPEATQLRLCKHLNGMKKGARLLTYENLHKTYGSKEVNIAMPFKQLEINVSEEDRFPTTWSTVRGHHFYLWEKLTDSREGEKK